MSSEPVPPRSTIPIVFRSVEEDQLLPSKCSAVGKNVSLSSATEQPAHTSLSDAANTALSGRPAPMLWSKNSGPRGRGDTSKVVPLPRATYPVSMKPAKQLPAPHTDPPG